MPGGRGLVLEGTGALHPFSFGDGSVTGLTVKGNAVWNRDMARGVAIVPEGTGGYVVDQTGALHTFRIGAGPKPAIPTGVTVWPGRDFARGIALLPNGMGGYTLDAAVACTRSAGRRTRWPGHLRGPARTRRAASRSCPTAAGAGWSTRSAICIRSGSATTRSRWHRSARRPGPSRRRAESRRFPESTTTGRGSVRA